MRRVLLALAIGVAAPLQAAQVIDAVTHYGYTSEARTIQFDNACPHCARYEWQLLSFEHGNLVASGQVPNENHQPNRCDGQVNALSIVVRMPRTGHYYVRARGCTADACSAWVTSMDAGVGQVDCQRRAWWLYGTVQPPGNPVFQ